MISCILDFEISEKNTLVLREPPVDGLRVARAFEPQDPEEYRGAKTQSENSKALSVWRKATRLVMSIEY